MKKAMVGVYFLTVLCFLVIWLPCQAADDSLYVCKNNKTGTPRLVSSPNLCKAKTEHLVTLTSGTQETSCGIKVYDANNQYLGYLGTLYESELSNSGLIEIYIPSLKKFAFIGTWGTWADDVGKKGIFAERSFYYESNNCTGTPYAENIYGIYKGPNDKYYTAKNGYPTLITKNSAGGVNGCSHDSSNFDSLLVEAIEVTLPFTVPVALPFRFE
jgi:hypothetical protein